MREDVMEESVEDQMMREMGEFEEDVIISGIEFYYDGVTGRPKFRMKTNTNTKEMKVVDPLNIFALACLEMIGDRQDELIKRMEDISGVDAWDDVVVQ